jgi:hypothetical protein
MHEKKGGNYSFDFNPYNSYPIIRMGYMRSKIQNHLNTVQAKLNNMKRLRLQGIKDDLNKNKSLRPEKIVIAHSYQKEYVKALRKRCISWTESIPIIGHILSPPTFQICLQPGLLQKKKNKGIDRRCASLN